MNTRRRYRWPRWRSPADAVGAGLRVLYIEDNSANIEVVSRFVKSKPNIRLQAVMSGRIGLEIATREVPDLILLDLHLPDLPGHEVLTHLKSEPATAAIPIAVLSAEAAPTVHPPDALQRDHRVSHQAA